MTETVKTEIELANCPFCGSPAEINSSWEGNGAIWWVACSNEAGNKKFDKAIMILEKRVALLNGRLERTSQDASFYGEIKEERNAMQRILDFVQTNAPLMRI